jgi:hypothetical protein
MDQNKIPHDPHHLGVLSGVSKMIFEPVVCSAQNHAPILRQDLQYLQMDRNKHPLEPHHVGVPSGAFKTISEPTVRLAQTVHLS